MFLPLPVCVKSSEVLVSLVFCTINTESVLNLPTTKWAPESLEVQTRAFQWYGRRAFHHLRMCQYVFALYASYSVLGLRSVMTTALDIDERLHSEVSLKQEQGNVRTVRCTHCTLYARRR